MRVLAAEARLAEGLVEGAEQGDNEGGVVLAELIAQSLVGHRIPGLGSHYPGKLLVEARIPAQPAAQCRSTSRRSRSRVQEAKSGAESEGKGGAREVQGRDEAGNAN